MCLICDIGFAGVDFMVLTKDTWDASWFQRDWLFPIDATNAASPTIGRASFGYNFGNMKRADQNAFAQTGQLDLSGQYIAIGAQPKEGDPDGGDVDIYWV